MIRLTKGPIPEVLVKNAADWTKVLLDRQASNQEPTDTEKGHYRHKDVKAALVLETNGKCAYCESKIRHVAHGDVEHIVPKSIELSKIFQWENLTLACEICNQNKSNHFGNHENLVDPYVVNPDDYFFFAGPMLLPLPTEEPAHFTESVLKLNRSELVERRIEKIHSLRSLMGVYANTKDAETRAVLRKDLETQETADDREYAALARYFVKEVFQRICGAQDQISEGAVSTGV